MTFQTSAAGARIGQSTVTARLQKLEDEIGQSLFHRSKSGAMLTAAGLKFRRYAEAMTDLWQQARQETSMPAGISSVCNFGCEIDLWHEIGRAVESRPHEDVARVEGLRDRSGARVTAADDRQEGHGRIVRTSITRHTRSCGFRAWNPETRPLPCPAGLFARPSVSHVPLITTAGGLCTR